MAARGSDGSRADGTPRSVRAPGKLFWLGEYVVLDGGPAVVAAVDRCAVLTWAPGRDRSIRVRSSSIAGERVARDASGALTRGGESEWALVDAVAETLRAEGALPEHGGVLEIDSSALSGASKYGLGSSGAVAAGATALWLDAAGQGEPAQVERLALAAHDRFQGGLGSGADVRASLHGGVIGFGDVGSSGPRTGAARVVLPGSLQFAAIWTGVSSDTRAFVRAIRAWREREGDSAERLLDRLRESAAAGMEALRRVDAAAWLRAVAAFCDAERAITSASRVPIVSAEVERAVRAAEEAGWVAKPSGAGGGDVIVAFAPRAALREPLAEACARVGAQLLDLSPAPQGVLAQLESNPR